jgi:Type II secretory pathway, component PulD
MIRCFVVCVAAGMMYFESLAFAGEVPPLPPTMPVSASLGTPLPSIAGGLPLAPLPHVKGGAFDLRFVSVGQLVDLLYGDALRVPHVIGSDVLQDSRLVSFQYDSKGGDLRAFVKVFLDSLGYKVETREGVDFVSKKDGAAAVSVQSFVYRPRFRSAAYLAKLVQPLFAGRVDGGGDAAAGSGASVAAPVAASGVVAPTVLPVAVQGASGGVAGVNDELVFSGKASEVADLRRLLPELDTAPGQVVVRGWVYEVSNTDGTNSAFQIAGKLLSGVLNISNGSTEVDPNALTFGASYLKLAISALSSDSRFKEVSDPHVRVMSGEQVSLNVGSQVPTLGSVSYQGTSGTPVQSVEYQDAGVIFNVRPVVMADRVEVELQEQISSFVATTTGVNNSPTKNTRQMTTTVSVKDGEVLVLGGLVQDSDVSAVTHQGWLPHFLDGRSSSKGRTEVLLVLQVQKV